LRPVHVDGLSLWTPGYASLAAFARGEPDPAVIDCASAWVPARLLRGASRLTRMLGESAEKACTDGGADPKRVATVYGSDYGEIETMVILLDTIFRGDGQLSPMRFKNSVHNAASGLGSIGQSNAGFSTALAAGQRSFEASMIEGIVLASETGQDVIVSVADDRLPEPFTALGTPSGLGVGIALRCEAPPDSILATITALAPRHETEPAVTTFQGRSMEAYRGNPTCSALPLIEALLAGRKGTVPLAHALPRPFHVTLS
jgi:hypothetical protein